MAAEQKEANVVSSLISGGDYMEMNEEGCYKGEMCRIHSHALVHVISGRN